MTSASNYLIFFHANRGVSAQKTSKKVTTRGTESTAVRDRGFLRSPGSKKLGCIQLCCNHSITFADRKARNGANPPAKAYCTHLERSLTGKETLQSLVEVAYDSAEFKWPLSDRDWRLWLQS